MKFENLKTVGSQKDFVKRKSLIPKYLLNSKNYELNKSCDLFLLGWDGLVLINNAVELEKKLRSLQFDYVESKKENSGVHKILKFTSLKKLLIWAKESKLLSNNGYEKGMKINKKRDIIAHTLTICQTKLVGSEKGEGLDLVFHKNFDLLFELKEGDSITLQPHYDKIKNVKGIRIEISNLFERTALASIKDLYEVLKEINKNKFKLK